MANKKNKKQPQGNIEFGKRRIKVLLRIMCVLVLMGPLLLFSSALYNFSVKYLPETLIPLFSNYYQFVSEYEVEVIGVGCFFFIWSQLIGLFEQRVAKRRISKIKTLNDIKKMDWRSFEEILADYYTMKGYRTTLVGGSGGDGGLDVVIRKGGKTYIVQAKHYKNNVGVPIVREMYGVMYHYKATGVIIITSSGFTKEAKEFAKGKRIELVTGDDLFVMFRNLLNGK